ncbi:ABC-three component system protein [uncultured Treponema sp.]|uniref:ABC-three component system protein n=1 Tax=uncultured Treponema sp. TaxID=162155 RepID=UPI00258504C2|nr:ABC-three component system protein [uncultured Treponema sp.]
MSVLFILETAEDLFSQVMEREDLFWDLIENSVKSNVSIKRTGIPRVLRGERDVSKKLADSVLDEKNEDKKHFQNYIENQINNENETFKRDSLVEKLPQNPYGVNTYSIEKNNVAFYFTEIWFKYLENCKNKIQHRNKNKPVAIDPLDIDERIKKVINAFKYIDEEKTGFTDTKMIKEKIDKEKNLHLVKKIENNVMDYFSEIRELFIEEQESNDLIYEQVRRKIRNQYLSRKEKTLQEIFNNLVDWLALEVGTTDREACEAVMSYFVQSCEVFSK